MCHHCKYRPIGKRPFNYRWLTTYLWLIYDEQSDKAFCKILSEHNQKRLPDSSMVVKRFLQYQTASVGLVGSTSFKDSMATRNLTATGLQLAYLHLQQKVLTLRLPRRVVSTITHLLHMG